MRKLSEVGLNDEEAAILREFITAVIIFMRENSCQALLSWKQRQRARDFWQTPFPCAQKHRALPPADTSSQFMKNNTNMSLCITAQNSWFTFRVKRTLRSLTKKKLVTQCFFFSFSFHCLAMREENQIMHLENEKRKRWGLWEFRASGALRKPLFICQELSWMCSTCGIYLLTFPPDLYQGKVSWGDDDYNHWSQAKVNYLLTLLKCCACLSLGSP